LAGNGSTLLYDILIMEKIHCCALQAYRTGNMLTGEVKKILIDILVTMVERHRRARAAVTEEVCCINLISL
jgi:tryptophanyl-tRNA synthetase